MSVSDNNKRIAKNTLMLYFRMLFSMGVSLYTSRVVLNTLGVEDYGIYNVVGGFVAMFSLFSSALSSAISRFLTFELGKGDLECLKRIFSTALFIQIVLVGIICILAETVGVYFLNTFMTIPTERLFAANWVFQASVLSFVLNLFCIPFNASIVAHERMKAFAYIGVLDVLLRLFAILSVAYFFRGGDKLIVYSFLLLLVSLLLQVVYVEYCRKHFVECRLSFSFDKQCWREMSSFACWNFIGCTAGLLREQGVNVLLNLFLGPLLNAARGIAGMVGAAVTSFSNSFMTALTPQIIKTYAAGEHSYMMLLVERGTRFSFYILLIIALPLLFETEFILSLWLEQYPRYTVSFVRLILLLSMCDILSNTLITLQLATGKIRNYQLAVGGMLMMNFPLSYLCLVLNFPPESTLIIAILISISCLFLRLLFLHNMVELSIKSYLTNVCANILFVTGASCPLPFVFYTQMADGWVRFALVLMGCFINCILMIYVIGCTESERNFVLSKIVTIIKKNYGKNR